MEDFLSITIVGALLSIVIQSVKLKFGTAGNMTKVVTVVLALVVGAGFVWLRSTPYLETVMVILGTSSVVYAFILRDFHNE